MAAGSGTRLGAGRPKALVPLADEPVVVHALRGALGSALLTDVVVVAPPDPTGLQQLAAAVHSVPVPPGVVVQVVPGGAERSDSVALGLRALAPGAGIVLVHDAARALTPAEVFDRVVSAVREGHAAVTPALPVTDTIKQVEGGPSGETVVGTLDRSLLRAVQTPQGFLRETLERAHAEVPDGSAGRPVTDDCGMVEALGGRVHVVPGHARAMKITTRHDLEVAAGWLQQGRREAEARTGTLIVLSGAPGVGKTTLARELGRRLGAAHLRVDTIEQGLIRGGLRADELAAQGYGAAYSVAADQLAIGLPVVADMVNGIAMVRVAWDEVGAQTGARVVRVVVECSDPEVHRARVTERAADIEGHQLPEWDQVLAREVAPWPEAHLRVDTAVEPPEVAAARIIAHLQEQP